MTVSKRTRFEVLRRDNHTCRYCRSVENPLTIDHVVPVALGGSDGPENLVACCKDCNAGKSSSSPDQGLVAQVEDDAVRWAQARARVVEKARMSRNQAAAARQPFLEAWKTWDKDTDYLPRDWVARADDWLALGVDMDQMLDALQIAMDNRMVRHKDVFRYVCGIIKRQLAALDEATAAELQEINA
jgi:hypothetical protein